MESPWARWSNWDCSGGPPSIAVITIDRRRSMPTHWTDSVAQRGTHKLFGAVLILLNPNTAALRNISRRNYQSFLSHSKLAGQRKGNPLFSTCVVPLSYDFLSREAPILNREEMIHRETRHFEYQFFRLRWELSGLRAALQLHCLPFRPRWSASALVSCTTEPPKVRSFSFQFSGQTVSCSYCKWVNIWQRVMVQFIAQKLLSEFRRNSGWWARIQSY